MKLQPKQPNLLLLHQKRNSKIKPREDEKKENTGQEAEEKNAIKGKHKKQKGTNNQASKHTLGGENKKKTSRLTMKPRKPKRGLTREAKSSK